ncbi:MAG: dihydropteroate synthase [Paludibacteraceae bacterium]|nr:dihydropteroate synthase [Paludibacteraceae bacterium]
MKKSILLRGQLVDFSRPRVAAIVNLSPDSFYTSYSVIDEAAFLVQIDTLLQEGADWLDLGACSTRPGFIPVSSQEEWQLLRKGIEIIRHHWPKVPLSVDTFRVEIAEKALSCGADMVNDVGIMNEDVAVWGVLANRGVPYILTYSQEAASTNIMSDMLHFFQERLDSLHRQGIADVVIDPGFGFAKTIQQNYAILRQLDVLRTLNAPILVGVSRKSMLYKPLQTTPADVLPATVAAHTLALERGADILRVHDVKAAVQAITIYQLTHDVQLSDTIQKQPR